MGPTLKYKKKNKKGRENVRQTDAFDIFFILFFSSLISLFDLRKSDRQNSSGQEANCSTQRGLRMGTKNTGFSRFFN